MKSVVKTHSLFLYQGRYYIQQQLHLKNDTWLIGYMLVNGVAVSVC
jgi:hypothetical protein